MKPARAVVIALCLTFFSTRPALSIQSMQDNALLDQSYNLSQKLGGPERLYHLIELCRISAQLQPPAARTKEFCTELYNIGSTEQNQKLRTLAQKNAVTYLSFVDAPRAMELLTQISFQRPRPGEIAYEDPRYNTAEKAFLNFLKAKHGDLAPIAAKAKFLGQTGQFPYRAVATIIQNLPNQTTAEINVILKDALGSYISETGFYNRDEEFLVLLQSVSHSTGIDRDLAAQMAAAFVQRLQNDPIEIPGDYYGEVHVDPSGKVFPFADRNAAFLFEAIPAIQSCNSALAAQLIQQDVKLGEAIASKLHYIAGGFVQGDPTAAEAAQQHLQWVQDSLVSRIKVCQTSDPKAATQLAQRLNNPESRILGFSAVIPALVRSNKGQAQAIYQKQFSELANLSTAMSRFRAIAALVTAAYHVDDPKKYESLSAQAFDIGSGFFMEDIQAGRAQRRRGFAELMDLVTFTASQPINVLQPKVQALPDDWLKAYLWLYEVEGHGKRKAQATPATDCSW